MSSKLEFKSDERALKRLMTLTDVVYAIGLVLVIQWLPVPSESKRSGAVWLLELFAEHGENLAGVLVGLVFLILYWIRSNQLLNHLERTNGIHITFAITQVFFVLMLLYVVRVSGEIAPASARAGESLALLLTGLCGSAGWRYASKRGLVRPGITSEQMKKTYIEAHAEPAVALITLPLAFVDALVWNLAWLLYIPVAMIMRSRL